jgi:hypothetical protein
MTHDGVIPRAKEDPVLVMAVVALTLALGGWGAFACSHRSSTHAMQELRLELQALKGELSKERSRSQESVSNLLECRTRVANLELQLREAAEPQDRVLETDAVGSMRPSRKDGRQLPSTKSDPVRSEPVPVQRRTPTKTDGALKRIITGSLSQQ